MKRTIIAGLATAALTLGVTTTAVAAPGGQSGRPDTACMQAGMATLKGVGLFSAVAKDGLPIATAVGVGVTVRDGADISGVPDPIPLNVVLADHRAGDDSLFVYPWCD